MLIKCLIEFLFINVLLNSFICLCYEVPNVKFNLLQKGFSLTLPDEPGLKQVFYVIKLNNECPTLMDILFEPQHQWTTIQTSRDIKPKDRLNISILANYQGEPFKSHQYVVVGENEMGVKFEPATRKTMGSCGDSMIEVKCEEASTVVIGMTQLCRDQLIFEDNFNDIALDNNKWSYDIRHRLIGTESEEFVLFDNHHENIFIHDGYLNIRPTLTQEKMRQSKLDFGTRCTPVINRKKECELLPQSPFLFIPPFNSSQIHTMNSFQFKYGRIEIKAKLPKGEWILPYIMLQNYGVYDEKQIRIAFARGNEHLLTTDNTDLSGKILYAGIVRDIENNNVSFKQKISDDHYGSDFHIYTLIWKSDEISMAVDGVQYGTITENMDDFDRFFFITFGVSVGGHLQFPDNLSQSSHKPWTNTSPRAIRDFWQYLNSSGKMFWSGNETLQIDYVKVFAI